MSLQGIPSSMSSMGAAKLTPKTNEAPSNPENIIGGAEVRDDMDKLKDSSKSLEKSRAEQRASIIEANLKTGKEKTSQLISNAIGKGVNPERMQSKEFGKVNNVLRRMSDRVRRGGSGRRSSEGASAQEELRQKNASTQSSLSARMRQLDNQDEDMDSDSEGGSDLSGGGRDQESTIMMLKSMYGSEESTKVEKVVNELPKNELDNTTKAKVSKGLLNSSIDPKSKESESVIQTLDSPKFKSLDKDIQSTVVNFVEQNNVKDTSFKKAKVPSLQPNLNTVIEDISITSKSKESGNIIIGSHRMVFKSKEVEAKVNLVSTTDSSGKTKIVTNPLYGSNIFIKALPNISKEKIVQHLNNMSEKMGSAKFSSDIGMLQNTYYVPNMGSVKWSVDQLTTIMLDPELNKPFTLRVPISFDESGEPVVSMMQSKLDTAYMSNGGVNAYYES